MCKTIFVTGVDTGVGKTVVAGALCAAMRTREIDVGVMKPVESGATARNGKPVGNDTRFLLRMANSSDPIDLVNPYTFIKKVSPYHAAKSEKITIDMAKILDSFARLKPRHEMMIVEGAGGLLCPLTCDKSMGNLALEMRATVLIVSHPFLGNINHTLLTAMAADRIGLKVAGIICNQYKNKKYPEPDFELISRSSGGQIFGLMPFIADHNDPAVLAEHLQANIDIDKLLESIETPQAESNGSVVERS